MVAPTSAMEVCDTSPPPLEYHAHEQERVPQEPWSSPNAFYCVGLRAQCRGLLPDRPRRGPTDSLHDRPSVRSGPGLAYRDQIATDTITRRNEIPETHRNNSIFPM